MHLYCQVCGAANDLERDYCSQCQQKLLVVSGPSGAEETESFEKDPAEQYSFDEHLLERISILEEVVKRTASGVRGLLMTLQDLERKTTISQTGLSTLIDLIDRRRILPRHRIEQAWTESLDQQLEALERRDRFQEVEERARALLGDETDAGLLDEHLGKVARSLAELDSESATRALDRALAVDPDNVELLRFRGELHFQREEWTAAVGLFERASDLEPDRLDVLLYLGVARARSGALAASVKNLTRAVERSPEGFLASFCLGAVLLQSRRWSEAHTVLRRAVEVEPLARARFLLGVAALRCGRVQKAIGILERAVEAEPGLVSARWYLSIALLRRGWIRRAATELERLAGEGVFGLEPVEISRSLEEDGALVLDEAPHRPGWNAAAVLDSAERRRSPEASLSRAFAAFELRRHGQLDRILTELEDGTAPEPAREAGFVLELCSIGLRYGRDAALRFELAASDGPRSSIARSLIASELLLIGAEEGAGGADSPDGTPEAAQESAARLLPGARAWAHVRGGSAAAALEELARTGETVAGRRSSLHGAIALLALGRREEALERLESVADSEVGLQDLPALLAGEDSMG